MDIEKEIDEFNKHVDKSKPAWQKLDIFHEFKYPNFYVHDPVITKKVSKPLFVMNVHYNMDLYAESGDAFIQVDFGMGENYLNLVHQGNKRMLQTEAQEKICCDSCLGYTQIINYFISNHMKMMPDRIFFDDEWKKFSYYADMPAHTIFLGKDILIFTNHENSNRVFRGHTGGWDPAYTFPKNFDGFSDKQQKDIWDSNSKIQSLERRIVSLKTIFDEVNEKAKFNIVRQRKPRGKLPDYKKNYANTLTSDNYRFMTEFEKRLRKEFRINRPFEKAIKICGDYMPTIYFCDEKSGMKFYVDYTGEEGMKFSSELHLPKHLIKDKKFDDRIQLPFEHPDLKDIESSEGHMYKPRSLIKAFEYVNSEHDLPDALEKCLKRLL